MKKEAKIGLFTILMILGAWGGVRFLSGVDLLSKNNEYFASYDQISGVQKASPIYIKGVKIGAVTDILLDAKYDGNVTLKLTISGRYNIPIDSEAKLCNGGLMGPKAVEIILGSSSEYLESGDTIASSRYLDIFDAAGSELDHFKNRMNEITEELSTTLRNLNIILEGNASNITSLVANLDALSHNLNALVESNEQSINTTIEGFAKVAQTMGDNTEHIDSILLNINTLTSDLSEAQIGTSLKSTFEELNTILQGINNEEGNIGKILNDEALYNNLAAASAGLDSLLADMKEHPSRYVHFSVFGRDDAKQQEKAEKRAAKSATK